LNYAKEYLKQKEKTKQKMLDYVKKQIELNKKMKERNDIIKEDKKVKLEESER